ncbi:MAG: helix-turn-helix domain-containing protein [Oscillospiraceae bacterium]|nr:helix-turn-helix domain-containing protein [Oscillospiraceae bacterium]
MTYSDIIIKRILTLCEEQKITVNKLATLSGMTQSTLENIVKGNTKQPGLRTLHRLAQGLGMTLSQFLDFPEIEETQLEDE